MLSSLQEIKHKNKYIDSNSTTQIIDHWRRFYDFNCEITDSTKRKKERECLQVTIRECFFETNKGLTSDVGLVQAQRSQQHVSALVHY